MTISETLETALAPGSGPLFVRQIKEWIEIAVDWETANRYQILDSAKTEVGWVLERGGGFLHHLKRFFLRSHRPLEVDVLDSRKDACLRLSRPFFWIFSDLQVSLPDGSPVGSIHRRFGILHKKYDLRNSGGHIFARISSPLWRLWTFPVHDPLGNRKSVITKQWGGALREMFTDADTYMLDFEASEWTTEERFVILAAAISIDFDFFENNTNRGGLLNWT
jgi:uncharacterized protein YxjI